MFEDAGRNHNKIVMVRKLCDILSLTHNYTDLFDSADGYWLLVTESCFHERNVIIIWEKPI